MVRSEQTTRGGAKFAGLFIIGLMISIFIPLSRITAQVPATPSRVADYQGTSDVKPDLYEQPSLALTGETRPSVLSPSDTAVSSVRAVVLRSFAGCDGTGMAWDMLNSDWANYGSTPLSIVYDDPELCIGEITYEDLVASDADVVVLSRVSGLISQDEITAIKQYAEEGHNLFATSSTFFNDFGGIVYENYDLLPLFGLQTGYPYTRTLANVSYIMGNANDPIFEGIGDPFVSEGYIYNYGPAIGPGGVPEWNPGALDGARKMADSFDLASAITFYAGNGYHAIYVSNAVEYTSGYGPQNKDVQFLYNALTYPETQKAVIVKSTGCPYDGVNGWQQLNKDWPEYGEIPIFVEIDHNTLCSDVTYEALAGTGADVVIVSSASGGYTAAEIAAFEQYIEEGHNLIGTYKTLGYGGFEDNSLEPLFGLNDDIAYDVRQGGILITQIVTDSSLFTGLPDPFLSSGFAFTQLPADLTWDESDLNGAHFVGKSADHKGVITLNSTPAYHAIYISSFAEQGYSESTSQQLLYNAISYGVFRPTNFQYLPGIIKGG